MQVLGTTAEEIEKNLKNDLFGLHASPEGVVRLRALRPLQPTVEFDRFSHS